MIQPEQTAFSQAGVLLLLWFCFTSQASWQQPIKQEHEAKASVAPAGVCWPNTAHSSSLTSWYTEMKSEWLSTSKGPVFPALEAQTAVLAHLFLISGFASAVSQQQADRYCVKVFRDSDIRSVF